MNAQGLPAESQIHKLLNCKSGNHQQLSAFIAVLSPTRAKKCQIGALQLFPRRKVKNNCLIFETFVNPCSEADEAVRSWQPFSAAICSKELRSSVVSKSWPG